jgi:signal transduction histidine kinase
MREYRRWAVPLGLLVIALTAFSTAAGGHVGLGRSGRPLVATVAVACYTVAGVVFLLVGLPDRIVIGLLLTMAVAVTLIHYADPDGPVVGLYLVVAFAPLRLPTRAAGTVAVVAVVLFDVGLLADSTDAVVFTLVVTGGAVFFYFFGLLLVREATQRRRADQLLVELRDARAAELRSAALAERASVAREMHDVLAHTLSGLAMRLEGLTLAADNQPVDEDFRSRLGGAADLARTGLGEARAVVSVLRERPTAGPDQVPALIETHTAAGEACTLHVSGHPGRVSAEVGLAIYRTIQEGLTNARKQASGATSVVNLHWQASRVDLTVDTGPIDSRAAGNTADLRDPTASGGSGLSGIAERARALGGSVESGFTEHGFRIHLTLPTTPPDADGLVGAAGGKLAR